MPTKKVIKPVQKKATAKPSTKTVDSKKTTVNTETAVSTNKQFTVNDVPHLLETVKKQISSIKKHMPNQLPVTGNLEGFGKIQEVKSLESLIKARSSVRSKARLYKEEAKEISTFIGEHVKLPSFSLNGHCEKTWLEVIDSQIILVGNETELTKLEKIQKTLEDNLSAEAKLANDLQSISNLLQS